MLVLVERLALVLAAAALVGLAFTALGGLGRSTPSAGLTARLIALATLAVAAFAVWLQVVPGRAGLWLDSALLVLASYAAGCGAGALLRHMVRSRSGSPAGPALGSGLSDS